MKDIPCTRKQYLESQKVFLELITKLSDILPPDPPHPRTSLLEAYELCWKSPIRKTFNKTIEGIEWIICAALKVGDSHLSERYTMASNVLKNIKTSLVKKIDNLESRQLRIVTNEFT